MKQFLECRSMERSWGILRGLMVAAVLVFLTTLPVSGVMAQDVADCPDTELASALDYFHLAWDVSKGHASSPSASQEPDLPETFWDRVTNEAYDHVDSLRSGFVRDNEYVRLETQIEGPASLSFWWKVDSQENADTLEFTVVPLDSANERGGAAEQGSSQRSISGSVDWTRVEVNLPEDRTYRARWTFRKDESESAGEDAGWIDQVRVRVDDAEYGRIVMNEPQRILGEGDEENSILLSWPTLPCRYYGVWWQPNNSSIEGENSFSEAVFATNSEQSISVWASLYRNRNYYVKLIEPPFFTQMPQPRKFDEREGDSFELAYEAEGSGTINFSWSFRGADDEQRERLPFEGDGRRITSGDQSSTLRIDPLREGHEGRYYLFAENKAGREQAPPVSLSVFQPPRLVGFVVREGEDPEYSIILDDPDRTLTPDLSVNLGERLEIEPEVGGSGTIETVWMREDPESQEWQPWPQDKNHRLVIEPVRPEHAGRYRLEAESEWGKWQGQNEVSIAVISPPTNLCVKASDQACIAQRSQHEVMQLERLTLSVEAAGTPEFEYQWYRDGSPLQHAQSQSLQVATDKGGLFEYKVQVTNVAGVQESHVLEITVHAPPKNLKVVVEGEQDDLSGEQIRRQQFDPVITLEVKAEKSLSPLSYLWYRDGVPIPAEQGGERNILSVTNDRIGVFKYHVEVTNDAGTVKTDPVEIAVRLCAAYVFRSGAEVSNSPPNDCSLATALNQIQMQDATNELLHQALGFALAATGHYDDARNAFSRVGSYIFRRHFPKLVPVLARTGELDLAASLIDEIIEDSRGRELSLLTIATAQAANDDIDAALETVGQIPQSSSTYFDGLTDIVRVLIWQGRIEDAGTFLSTHTDGLNSWVEEHADYPRSALRKIAETQALLGDFSGATETARRHDRHPDQSRLGNSIPNNMQLRLAVWQAKTGDLSGALQRLESVPLLERDRHPWNDILDELKFNIFIAAIHAGAISEIGGAIDSIHDENLRLRLLLELQSAQAEANDNDGAAITLGLMMQLAEETNSTIIRARALARLAVRLHASGSEQEAREHLATAIELAEQADSNRVAEIWVNIAIAQALMGDIDACIETFEHLEEPDIDSAVSSVVRQLTTRGDFDSALTLVEQSHRYPTRVAMLVGIALSQNRHEDREGAIETFGQAYQAYLDYPEKRSRVNLDERGTRALWPPPFVLGEILHEQGIQQAMPGGYIQLALQMAHTLANDPAFGDSPYFSIVHDIQEIMAVNPILFEIDVELIEAVRQIRSQSARLVMLASIVALAHQAENWRQRSD